jgi:hypothetical protein
MGPEIPLGHPSASQLYRSPRPHRLMAVVIACGLMALLGLLLWQASGA